MSEEKKEVVIELEKHLWPDQEAELLKKKKEKKKNRLIVLLIVFLTISSLGIGIYLGANTFSRVIYGTNDSELLRFETIYNKLKSDWYFNDSLNKDGKSLIDRAIEGMIGNDYDPFTSYMDKDSTDQFNETLNQGFVGIGVEYLLLEEGLRINKVFLNSPAEKAGIKAGDLIIKVDDISVNTLTTEEVINHVRGKEGTEVKLTYIRNNVEYSTVAIRGAVESSVYGEILSNNVGYLEISQFASGSSIETKKYFKYFKDNNVDKLIIDVRDNGGGYLNVVLEIADFLLDNDQIIMTQEYSDGSIVVSKADGKIKYQFSKIVILGNGNSASASEALIGALVQNNKAIFVGERTYGKSTIQTPTYYNDGSSLKMTTGVWHTPNGSIINNVGIEPDVTVTLHPVYYLSIVSLNENEVLKYDQVDYRLVIIQYCLDYLGYNVDRFDGYFSRQTEVAVKEFEKDFSLNIDGILSSQDVYNICNQASLKITINQDDVQLDRTIEIVNE